MANNSGTSADGWGRQCRQANSGPRKSASADTLPIMTLKDIFAVTTAGLAALGGGTAIVFGLSSWLGKVWASRIMEAEKAELSKSIETLKAELTRSLEEEKAKLAKAHEYYRTELQELSHQRQDALNRKRDVYTRLAGALRVFLQTEEDKDRIEENKRAFLMAYDEAYVWAAEEVVSAVGSFIRTIEEKTAVDQEFKRTNQGELVRASEALNLMARKLYQSCMREMRKDSGYPKSEVEHRVVTFN